MNIQNYPQLLDVVAQYAEFHIKSKRLNDRVMGITYINIRSKDGYITLMEKQVKKLFGK